MRRGARAIATYCILFAAGQSAVAAEAGPIVIDKGGTYTGQWASNDPATPVVRVTTREPVVIEQSTFRGRGALIVAEAGAADLTIRNCRGIGENPNIPDRAAGRFLQADEPARLTIERCEMTGTTGIYVHRVAKGAGVTPSIRIVSNLARNIDGRRSDGQGGYRDFSRRTRDSDKHVEEGFDLVQFVQLDGAVGLGQCEIAWNQVVNEPGRSRVEDNISIYESSGTKDHPLLIHDNCIVGAYSIDPARGNRNRDGWTEDESYTGGGIMLGDGPGKSLETASGFVRAERNVVVSTSNYGIAVAAGHDIEMIDNQVLSSGTLGDGRPIAAQNVGIYVWDAAKGKRQTPPTFFDITGHGNEVGWATRGKRSRNDWWLPDVTKWDGNHHWPAPVTPATEADLIDRWLARAKTAGHAPGMISDPLSR